jgi:hypothetical protein
LPSYSSDIDTVKIAVVVVNDKLGRLYNVISKFEEQCWLTLQLSDINDDNCMTLQLSKKPRETLVNEYCLHYSNERMLYIQTTFIDVSIRYINVTDAERLY